MQMVYKRVRRVGAPYGKALHIKYNPQVPSIAIELYHNLFHTQNNLTCYIVGRDEVTPPYMLDIHHNSILKHH